MLDDEPTLLNKEGIPFKFVEKEKKDEGENNDVFDYKWKNFC